MSSLFLLFRNNEKNKHGIKTWLEPTPNRKSINSGHVASLISRSKAKLCEHTEPAKPGSPNTSASGWEYPRLIYLRLRYY